MSAPSSQLREIFARPSVRRWARRGRWVLVALIVVLGGAQLYFGSASFEQRVLAKVRAELTERTDQLMVGDSISIDLLGRVSVGPVTSRAQRKKLPVLTIAEVRVRPSYWALLRGRVEPASVHLTAPEVHAGPRGRELRELVDRLRAGRPGAKPASRDAAAPRDRYVRITFEEARVFLGAAGAEEELLVPEGAVSLEQKDGERRVWGSLSLGASTTATLKGSLGAPGLRVDAALSDLEPSALPPFVRERLPVLWEGGDVGATLAVRGDPKLESVRGTLSARVTRTSFVGERLAEGAVGPVSAELEVEASWKKKGRVASLDKLAFGFGPQHAVTATVQGRASFSEWTFEVTGKLGPFDYARAVASLPAQLRPPPEAPSVQGTISGQVSASGPLFRPEEWAVEAKLDLKKLGAQGEVPLLQPFAHQAVSGERARQLEVGPQNPAFVPIAELPTYVFRAVTTAEDAGFFAHQGFDFSELTLSIVQAAKAERMRGASTISQQLAKNLFLSREKTYVRKVREALVTLALEATVPKQRLLELYLNIIEWGPGVFGLGEASRYYFGVDARQLTVKQAAFLATIIPNPIKYHVYFTRGELTEHWQKRVDDLLARLHELQVIDEVQYAAATAETLTFRASETPSPRRPAPRR